MNNLNELSQSIYQANKEKGFWEGRKNVGEVLMLVTSELAEALEADRKSRRCLLNATSREALSQVEDQSFFIEAFQGDVKHTFEDEIADAMIRILDLCGGFDIDIEFHIREKLRYNATRPFKHGKKY